jgi:hypothetical protein
MMVSARDADNIQMDILKRFDTEILHAYKNDVKRELYLQKFTRNR